MAKGEKDTEVVVEVISQKCQQIEKCWCGYHIAFEKRAFLSTEL